MEVARTTPCAPGRLCTQNPGTLVGRQEFNLIHHSQLEAGERDPAGLVSVLDLSDLATMMMPKQGEVEVQQQ